MKAIYLIVLVFFVASCSKSEGLVEADPMKRLFNDEAYKLKVAPCAVAIMNWTPGAGDVDRDRDCDKLSKEDQSAAAKIATIMSPVKAGKPPALYLPPFEAKAAGKSKVTITPPHHYVMQDGMQYGYPSAISAEAKQAGQAAEKLIMVHYAGTRDGKHQAHIMNGTTVEVIECGDPCDYAKSMLFIDNPVLKDQIRVERFKAQPGSIAWAVMADAINGELRTYGVELNGKTHNAWVDEKRGMQYTPVKSVSKAAQ